MPIELPEPDGSTPDGTPLWTCPHCEAPKPIEEFGWRKRDDIHPGENIFHKQSWCIACRGEQK